MDISTMYVAEIIHRERLVQAEQARKWAQPTATIRLRDRVRQALAVPGRLAHRVRDQGRRFHHVQPQAATPPRPGEFRGEEDEQPVPFGL